MSDTNSHEKPADAGTASEPLRSAKVSLGDLTPENMFSLKRELAKLCILGPWGAWSLESRIRCDTEKRQVALVHPFPRPQRHGLKRWLSSYPELEGRWEVLVANPQRAHKPINDLMLMNYDYVGLVDSLEEGMVEADKQAVAAGYRLCGRKT